MRIWFKVAAKDCEFFENILHFSGHDYEYHLDSKHHSIDTDQIPDDVIEEIKTEADKFSITVSYDIEVN